MKILHIFTLLTTSESFFDQQFKYLNEAAGQEIWVVSSSDENLEFSKRNNISYLKEDIRRSISPIADIITIHKIKKLIQKEQFDVVVGHTPKGAMIAMVAAALARTKHRVYYRHGLVYTTTHGLLRFILKTVERFTALCATNIVNVSPSLGKLAVDDKLNSHKKQTLIGYGTCGGIDTQYTFNPELLDSSIQSVLRKRYGIAAGDFVVGFCGRLCKDKGIQELIAGFELFLHQHKTFKAKLLLVGTFDKRDILSKETLDKIQSNPDIITTGYVDKHDLPYYYSIMDIFVFPSHREGFGMCVIEASAMEVPILVSKSHGCIDSIVDGKTGEYINLTPDDIAQGIEKMLDSSKRRLYGKQGRRWVCNNFECTMMWPRIAAFFNSLNK